MGFFQTVGTAQMSSATTEQLALREYAISASAPIVKALTFNASTGGYLCGLSLSPDVSLTSLTASDNMSAQFIDSWGTPGIRFRSAAKNIIAKFWDAGTAQFYANAQVDGTSRSPAR